MKFNPIEVWESEDEWYRIERDNVAFVTLRYTNWEGWKYQEEFSTLDEAIAWCERDGGENTPDAISVLNRYDQKVSFGDYTPEES